MKLLLIFGRCARYFYSQVEKSEVIWERKICIGIKCTKSTWGERWFKMGTSSMTSPRPAEKTSRGMSKSWKMGQRESGKDDKTEWGRRSKSQQTTMNRQSG